MTTQVNEHQTVDTSGTLCPLPVIAAKQAMDKLGKGQVLKIIATDPGAKADIPSWARASGHTLLKQEVQGKRFVFWVQKG
ncbi:MAG: sulfurtransferase TusA family protein [Dehalococcoidia bacterium]|nr:sulfurtransferase TusA family protein [Dehalococcoidia bacterium]MDW8119543.1 sulfurtransferase TusA family protein [Chloroflexota bacterium]